MKLPVFPSQISRMIASLPSFPPSALFAFGCNRLAWNGLHELDWSVVQGRRVCIHVSDLGLRLYLSVQADGLRAVKDHEAEVTFTASAADFARLALRLEDPDTLFFNRRLLIEGDTDLGLTLKNLLDTVDLESLAAAMPAGLGRPLLALRRHALA